MIMVDLVIWVQCTFSVPTKLLKRNLQWLIGPHKIVKDNDPQLLYAKWLDIEFHVTLPLMYYRVHTDTN